MSHNIRRNNMIWIIGAGAIASEYAKVLRSLKRDFIVIGRGEESARLFYESTAIFPVIGGLRSFLKTKPLIPEKVINCVQSRYLASTTLELIEYGVRDILSEKPGFYPEEMEQLNQAVSNTGTNLTIAYNRRFFSSVFAAEEIIKKDGGLLSFNFEFTEWRSVFDKFPESRKGELKHHFIGNSTHVVDLAFFLGGEPKALSCYSNGTVGWHSPSNFTGAGETANGVLFSYNANWNAPGRWGIELLTSQHRIFLKPMEQLQLQDISTVTVYPVVIDDHLDKEFKPGFYLETKAFLENDTSRLCSMEQQVNHVRNIYNKILGRQ